jgi:hypothetical protein
VKNKSKVECIFADRRVLSLGLEVGGRTASVGPLSDLIDSIANPQNITSESDWDR